MKPAKHPEQVAWRTRSLVYGLLGPVRGCIAPLIFAVERTAELLFLHKNTVKYRLQRTAGRLGYPVGKMPETFALYTACALERLLGS